MDSYTNDLELLTIETFQLNETLPSRNPFEEDEINYPQSAGVIFKLEINERTFCIRGVACANISQMLMEQQEQLWDALKMETASEFVFFQTDDLMQAEVIVKQLINRRFFLEHDFCGIQQNWWLKGMEDGFSLHFHMPGLDQGADLQCLGPLGDGGRLIEVLNNSNLSGILEVEGLFCSRKSIVVKCRQDALFRRIFLGEADCTELPDNYLRQLTFIRRFWLSIERLIASNLHPIYQ